MLPVIHPDSVMAVDTGITDRALLDKKLPVFSHRDLGFKVARLQSLPFIAIHRRSPRLSHRVC